MTAMRPLLCELHAHTTWSDGTLSLRELVHLYGTQRLRRALRHRPRRRRPATRSPRDCLVRARSYPPTSRRSSARPPRARERYGLLLLAGLELTFNDADPDRAAHALAVGLRSAVPLEDGIAQAMTAARAAGAAVVAAHPSGPGGARRARDPPLLERLRRAGAARRPLGARQPPRRLPVGRRAPPARGRERRLPPPGAPRHLEDGDPVPQGSRRGRAATSAPGRSALLAPFEPFPAQIAA